MLGCRKVLPPEVVDCTVRARPLFHPMFQHHSEVPSSCPYSHLCVATALFVPDVYLLCVLRACTGSRIHNEAVALARLSPEKRASRELKGGGSVNSSVNSRLSNSSPVRHASHNSSSAVAVPKAV